MPLSLIPVAPETPNVYVVSTGHRRFASLRAHSVDDGITIKYNSLSAVIIISEWLASPLWNNIIAADPASSRPLIIATLSSTPFHAARSFVEQPRALKAKPMCMCICHVKLEWRVAHRAMPPLLLSHSKTLLHFCNSLCATLAFPFHVVRSQSQRSVRFSPPNSSHPLRSTSTQSTSFYWKPQRGRRWLSLGLCLCRRLLCPPAI